MTINTVKVRKSTRVGMSLLMTVSCETTVSYVFTNTANADSTIVANRSYGVDVASYQGTDLSPYARAGAKFAIVKTTEGTWYVNPNAAGQIASSKSLGMMTMGYHFANFSNDSSRASQEADFAISKAKALGVPGGSYYAIDWEKEGSTNIVTGSKQSNTDAILTFMRKVKVAGYLPLLYSGASFYCN